MLDVQADALTDSRAPFALTTRARIRGRRCGPAKVLADGTFSQSQLTATIFRGLCGTDPDRARRLTPAALPVTQADPRVAAPVTRFSPFRTARKANGPDSH